MDRFGIRRFSALLLGALLTSAVLPATVSGQWDASQIRSALSGVYTEEQAAEGLEIFNQICSNCHNERHPLGGESFMRVWSGQSIYRLYDFMSTRMPYTAPGSLQPEQYAAMIAYVLKLNGYPAGETPFPVTTMEIAYINFDPQPDGR